jgi:excisionase family DNA binding protein
MIKGVRVEDLISLAEAARLRGVSRQAIDDLVKRGKLATVEIAGRRLVSRQDVNAYEPELGGRPHKAVEGKVQGKVNQPKATREAGKKRSNSS